VAGVIAITSGGGGQRRGGSWTPSRQLHHSLEDGIVLLELFGRIGSGLVAVLQAGLKVKYTSMLMWMRRLDRWPSDIHGD
jgi:hypothetical protein